MRVCCQVPRASKTTTAIPWDLSCLSVIPQNMTKSCLGFLGVFWPGKVCQVSLEFPSIVVPQEGACELPSLLSPGPPALSPTQCLFCLRGDFVCVCALLCLATGPESFLPPHSCLELLKYLERVHFARAGILF